MVLGKCSKILIVDDDTNFLSSMRRIMRSHFEIVTTTDPVHALKIIEHQGPFSVVISDFRMPFMNGIELFSKIHSLDKNIQRIMLTGCAELQMAIDAINHGKINAFLTKPTPSGSIRLVVLDAIRTYHECIAKDKTNLEIEQSSLLEKPAFAPFHTPLTVKEMEVLSLLAKGFSNVEIATELHVTIGTVKTHLNNIFEKFNVNNRTKAVAKGRELALIKRSGTE